MTEEKKQAFQAKDILNIVFFVSFVFSQFFYLNIWFQQGLSAFALHLALAIPGPHIHDVLQNPSLLTDPTPPFPNSKFDIIKNAFSWPVSGLGWLTGIGVTLTTFVFNLFDTVVLNIVIFVLYLAILF